MEQFNVDPFIEAAVVIETSQELTEFLSEISESDVLAVDTESAAFYKYKARVNLIQVATRKRAAILDPQFISDFTPLVRFAENAKCEWIFHGGDYDAAVLARELGVRVRNAFDTRIAAELLGSKELGLSSLTAHYLGFALDKRLQRCDWSRRPLTTAMKRYALLDAVCLIPVRDALKDKLEAAGRLGWAQEEFQCLLERFVNSNHNTSQFQRYPYLIKGSARMEPRQIAVLKEVWSLREKIAEELDRAPFMVLSNQALLEIARQAPCTKTGLSIIKEMGRDFLARYGKELQESVKRGLSAPLENLTPPVAKRRQNFFTAWEAELIHAMKEKRSKVANRIGLSASLLTDQEVIGELARLRPQSIEEMKQIPGFRSWQADIMCGEYLPLLLQKPPAAKTGRAGRRRKPLSKQKSDVEP